MSGLELIVEKKGDLIRVEVFGDVRFFNGLETAYREAFNRRHFPGWPRVAAELAHWRALNEQGHLPSTKRWEGATERS